MTDVSTTMRILAVICFMTIFNGCSIPHKISIKMTPAETVYTIHEKIPGKIVLIIDDNVRTFQKTVRPDSIDCSGHVYSVDLDPWLSLSIKKSTEMVFEEVIELTDIPTNEQLEQLNSYGMLFVGLKSFYTSLSIPHHTFAKSSITLDVFVSGRNNEKLFINNVGGYGEADGDIIFCIGIDQLLSDAISKSIQNAMDKYASLLSNSIEIRRYFYYLNENEKSDTESF